jgi:SAM-dependent methyltransferase
MAVASTFKRAIISSLPSGLLTHARNVKDKIERRRTAREIERVLKVSDQPDTRKAEADFIDLQAAWPAHPEYGYDVTSLWQRASQRASHLLTQPRFQQAGLDVLEVGAGDGMLGVLFESYGHRATLTDQDDWRDDRARRLPFVKADFCQGSADLPSNYFDLVVSFNSMEHLPDPQAALGEMIRVAKPGGSIRLDFGPLYNGPWGLHAYRAIRAPYPQFLFSEEFVAARLREIGIWDLGQRRDTLQYVNRWSLAQYQSLFRGAGCRVVELDVVKTEVGLDVITAYPESFRGRQLSLSEVSGTNLVVQLEKPA